jgi:ketosteroid isomerase-like protein
MLKAAEAGNSALRSQRYELKSFLADGDHVALELDWSGTLAISFGALQAGRTLRARIAMFLELKDGLIFRVRNYDCHDPL